MHNCDGIEKQPRETATWTDAAVEWTMWQNGVTVTETKGKPISYWIIKVK